MLMIGIFGIGYVQAANPMQFLIEPNTAENAFIRETLNGSRYKVYANGEIDLNAAERLEKFIRQNNIDSAIIVFNSSGGSIAGGIKIGRYIRSMGFSTGIGRLDESKNKLDSICTSACAYAFSGGLYRYYYGENEKLGLHQFHFNSQLYDSSSATQVIGAELIEYLQSMGVDPKAFVLASKTNRNQMRWLTQSEALDLNIANNGSNPTTVEIKLIGANPYLRLEQVLRDVTTRVIFGCFEKKLTILGGILTTNQLSLEKQAGLVRSYIGTNEGEIQSKNGQQGTTVVGNVLWVERLLTEAEIRKILNTKEIGVWTENGGPFRWGATLDTKNVRKKLDYFFRECNSNFVRRDIGEIVEVVKIGHVGPTTGAIGHLGLDNQYGAQMAINELNAANLKIGGKLLKFELVVEDDAADPNRAIEAAKKLVAAKVNGVIGHLNSGATIPASKIYNDAGIPQISPSATNPKYTRQGYKGAFRMVADDVQLASTLAKYATKTLKAKKIAVINDGTAYGNGLANEFAKFAKSAGVELVIQETVKKDNPNLFSLLTSLKIRNTELIFYGGMDDGAGQILQQMKQLGMNTIFMGGDGICTNDLFDVSSKSMKDGQVICAEAGGIEHSIRKGMEKFRSDFKAEFGYDVQVYAPYTYDAVHVMAIAMINSNSTNPQIYLPALKGIKHQGVTGKIAFDAKGDIVDGALTLMSYSGGQRVTIEVIR